MNIYKCFGACSVKISMFALALGLAACGGENSTSVLSNNLSEDDGGENSTSVPSNNLSEDDGGENSTSVPSNNLSEDDGKENSTSAPSNNQSAKLTTYGTMTDERDGQVYETVTVGTQTWMAENLNYTYTEPPFDVDYDTTGLCFLGNYCNGRLYTWAAAMDSASLVNSSGTGETVRGVCPSGWHLPSNKEWETLWDVCEVGDMTFTHMQVQVNHCSGYLKTSSILAGGNYAQFWSSTEVDDDRAKRWYPLHDGYAIVSKEEKSSLLAVRCVQD